MWQSVDHKTIFTEISLQLKKGIVDENDLNLLHLCIKKQVSKPSVKIEDEKDWFKAICGEILLEWRPLINELDCPNKTRIDKMMIDVVKMAIVIDNVFGHVLIQITNLLSDLHKSLNSEIEKCLEESLILKMKDTVCMLLILCDSMKLHHKDLNPYRETTVSVLSDILLMEWVSEKDFVILNQVFTNFLNLTQEQDKQILVSIMKNLHKRKDFTLLLLFMAIHLEKLSKCDLIIKRVFFWIFLQDGLVCSDPLARKRALFIIKYLLDTISKKEFATDSVDDASLILWNPDINDKLWKIWKTIALIYETLEEKQVHVINPILPSVDEVLEASHEGLIHSSWLLLVLTRAMAHESKLIQTWAINYTLRLDLRKIPLFSQYGQHFIFNVFFESLKNIFLYTNDEDDDVGDPPKVFSLLKQFFTSCFSALPGKQLSEFLTKILDKLSDTTFNQISLIYITMALSDITSTSKLDKSHLAQLHHFLMSKISIYSSDFQTIIFQNLSMFFSRNLDASGCYVQGCLTLIATAYRAKVLKFGSQCWNFWVDYFKMIEPNILKLFLKDSFARYESSHYDNANAICFEIVVLIELMSYLQLSIEKRMLPQILTTLTKLPTNPYMPIEKVFKCLQFANLKFNKHEFAIKQNDVVDFVIEKVDTILMYIKQKFFSPISDNAIESDILKTCIGILNGMTSHSKQNNNLKTKMVNFVRNNLSNILDSLKRFNESAHTSRIIHLQLLSAIVEIAVEVQSMEDFTQQLIQIVINFDRSELATHGPESLSSICDTFISSIWTCLDVILDKEGIKISEEKQNLLFSCFQSDITMASNETTYVLTKFSKHFANIFNDKPEFLCELVDYLWKIIDNHIRDGQGLWLIYKNCIQTILHKNLLCHKDENILIKVLESWDKIFDLGERKMAVTSIAVKKFFAEWKADSSQIPSLVNYVDVCIKIATFGPLRQKKEKPFHHLYLYLKASNQIDETHGFKSFQQYDQEVRITFIDFLLNLPNNSEIDELVVSLIKLFICFDQAITKKCFYLNSLVHRQKLRCWQSILLLLSKLPVGFDFAEILLQLFSSCKSDNQLSVRYLIEWVIVLIILAQPQLIDKLIHQFELSSEKKIFSVTYILSSLIQLVKSVSDEQFEHIVDHSLLKALPWAHSQHMTSRVHSHVLLELMDERMKKLKNPTILEKYHFLEHCFTLSEKNTAAVKHRKELSSTYYVSSFNALKNFNLETIFHDFLKNHGVIGDEWISYESFSFPEAVLSNYPLLRIEKKNKTQEKANNTNEDPKEIKEIKDVIQQQYVDTQKKIMPWNLVPSDDLILQSELSRKKDLGTSDLVLCAVLVDKIPNLGGLSRTAEIFGVKRLLIGSNRYLADPSFKSLSVTSEKWLDIEQVIPIKLASYLNDMRQEGYTIVGVEQTANSKMIGEFKFPHKSVLVLGNEKTGIPVEIIQLLDECVEIPQLGIIRSLNVHISGAIMVWEYCKQHSL